MNSIDETIQRTRRYWFVDGLNELASGFFLVLMALLFWGAHQLSAPFSILTLAVLFPVLIFAGRWATSWLVRRLKERITYPRTGYVTYRPARKHGRRVILLTLLGAMLSAALIIFLLPAVEQSWLPVMMGFFCAALTAYFGYQFGLRRFYVLAAVTLGAGLAIAFWVVAESVQLTVFLGAYGLGWMISGGVTLIRYLAASRQAEL